MKKKPSKAKPRRKPLRRVKTRRETALARSEQSALTPSDRLEVAEALDRALREPPKKLAVLLALRRAAEALAPHFGVTAAFVDQGIPAGVQDAKLLVEVLCSAAAWLAYAKEIPADELRAQFAEWMADQGYPAP